MVKARGFSTRLCGLPFKSLGTAALWSCPSHEGFDKRLVKHVQFPHSPQHQRKQFWMTWQIHQTLDKPWIFEFCQQVNIVQTPSSFHFHNCQVNIYNSWDINTVNNNGVNYNVDPSVSFLVFEWIVTNSVSFCVHKVQKIKTEVHEKAYQECTLFPSPH